jgi:type I protein arginine methyltransferase
MMYTLRDYGNMVSDERRVELYARALRGAVKPGSVVLDIGTGAGVLAMIAARLGARRVFAIEPSDVIELAREIAAQNGLDGRIEFMQGVSTSVELPERADVVVAEIHGILPLFGRSVATWIDARDRLLAPGGTMIPARETVFASVVEAPALHSQLVAPWSETVLGLDMRRGRRHVVSQICRAEFTPGDLLAPAVAWTTLDYLRIQRTDVSSRIVLEASRAGSAHGLGLWFESDLADGVRMTNAPGEPPLIFGNAYLPWPEPVEVSAGDVIEVEIAASPLDDRYLWRWDSRVSSKGSERACFRQSQFDAVVIVPEKLKRQAASHVARLNEEGEMQRVALARMADGCTLGDIATELERRFPGRFPRWHDSLNWVGELALRCSD